MRPAPRWSNATETLVPRAMKVVTIAGLAKNQTHNLEHPSYPPTSHQHATSANADTATQRACTVLRAQCCAGFCTHRASVPTTGSIQPHWCGTDGTSGGSTSGDSTSGDAGLARELGTPPRHTAAPPPRVCNERTQQYPLPGPQAHFYLQPPANIPTIVGLSCTVSATHHNPGLTARDNFGLLQHATDQRLASHDFTPSYLHTAPVHPGLPGYHPSSNAHVTIYPYV